MACVGFGQQGVQPMIGFRLAVGATAIAHPLLNVLPQSRVHFLRGKLGHRAAHLFAKVLVGPFRAAYTDDRKVIG